MHAAHHTEFPPAAGWLEAVSVAASLEDARLAAITALKALLTAAHKQRLAAAGSASAAIGGGAADSGSGVTAVAVQSALAVLADALGEVARHARERTTAAQLAAAEASAVDAAGAHLSNAAEAAYILLLLAQRWAGDTAAAGAAEAATAAVELCAGVLQATGCAPACLPACRPACRPTRPPTCLPASSEMSGSRCSACP